MALLIFQIIVACVSFLGLFVLCGALFFLLKTYGPDRSVRGQSIILSVLLAVSVINIVSSGYLEEWAFSIFEGSWALAACLSGGYIFKQLPVYKIIRNKIRSFLMLEPLPQTPGLSKEEELLPVKSVSNLLTAKQKEKLEKMMNTPDIFCDKRFTAKEFAKQVGTNMFYLNQYLKQQVGMTSAEYIISRRLDKAENILAETEVSVLDVCDSIGFKSPTSLFALFKKRHGMSPLQWRNRNRVDM